MRNPQNQERISETRSISTPLVRGQNAKSRDSRDSMEATILPAFSMWFWYLFFLAFCVMVCIAPRGMPTSALGTGGASCSTSVAAGAAFGAAAAAGASWGWRKQMSTAAAACQMPRAEREKRADAPVDAQPKDAPLELSADDASSDEEWDDGEDSGEEAASGFSVAAPAPAAAASVQAGKLWSKAEFPEGVYGKANWDLANLEAAQAWECPCVDRVNCIGNDRIPNIFDLYEHRKKFRCETAPANGGLRDAARLEMTGHFDKTRKTLTRSFVVGPVGDCCAASAGLAKGLSFATWAGARSDLNDAGGEPAPWKEGRRKIRNRQESEKRAHFRAWIRSLKDGMEGPKGGSDPIKKWKTGYLPRGKRWEQYCESRRRSSQPIVGGKDLLCAPSPRMRTHSSRGACAGMQPAVSMHTKHTHACARSTPMHQTMHQTAHPFAPLPVVSQL